MEVSETESAVDLLGVEESPGTCTAACQKIDGHNP